MIAKLGFFASHLNIDDSVSVLCELYKTPVDSELQNPVNKIMILLTLERKYLKVEQSFAQSRFHITSLLSGCGGQDAGAQWMSRYTNYASLATCSRSSYLHIFISSYHTYSTLQRNSQLKEPKTRQDNKYQLSNRSFKEI